MCMTKVQYYNYLNIVKVLLKYMKKRKETGSAFYPLYVVDIKLKIVFYMNVIFVRAILTCQTLSIS